jgi:hypothetical protein
MRATSALAPEETPSKKTVNARCTKLRMRLLANVNPGFPLELCCARKRENLCINVE